MPSRGIESQSMNGFYLIGVEGVLKIIATHKT
jgi:hypothetical protein